MNFLSSNFNLILFLGGGIAIILVLFSRHPYHYPQYQPHYQPYPSNGCFGSILGYFVMIGGILLSIYLVYAIGGQKENVVPDNRDKQEIIQRRMAKDSIPESRPPGNEGPIEQEWGKEYKPDSNRRYNVGRLPIETYSPHQKLVDEKEFEDEIHKAPVPMHIYIQNKVAPTEERAISAWRKLDQQYPDQVHIGYDTNMDSYPYKLLIGPFENKAAAKKAAGEAKVWIRDLRKDTSIYLLDIASN